jgi:hypothetical protein
VQNIYSKINELNALMRERNKNLVYSIMKYDELTYRVIVHEGDVMVKNLSQPDFLREYKAFMHKSLQ